MYAEFKLSLDDQDRINNKLAHLYLFTDYYEQTWKLSLNLESFEVMHGLSRIVLLLPDKIATAIAINKEVLPDPDDGTYLIPVFNLVTMMTTMMTLLCHDWRNLKMKLRKTLGKKRFLTFLFINLIIIYSL